MSFPNKSFKVYSVSKIDFINRTYDSVKFFKDPKDAESLRGDLNLEYAESESIIFIVEYCDRSDIV